MKKSKQKYIDYLKRIGITIPRYTLSEKQSLISRFGENCFSRLDDIDNTTKEAKELYYREKNNELEYSLAFTNIFIHDFLVKTMAFAEKNPHLFGKQIIDIGCDNGILTCFYAFMYPDAKVVGIDYIDESITCARNLAKKLALTNVSFENIKIENFNQEKFDTAISTAFIHEATGFSYGCSCDSKLDAQLAKNIACSISDILDLSATYISIERLSGADTIFKWIQASNAANLSINFEQSGKLEWASFGEKETFPIFVYKKESSRGTIDYSRFNALFNTNNSAIDDNLFSLL